MRVLIVAEGASELAGALKALVTRLHSSDLDIEQEKVSSGKIHAHHGKGRGYFKRAVRWMIEAEKRGFDALVLVIDEDGRHERTKQFSDAQEYTRRTIRRALGVAIPTFDAWMLADEVALTSVFEFPVSRRPDPEAQRNPKSEFASLCDQVGVLQSVAEMYLRIAERISLDLLESRCPKGFAPFASRVRAL